MAATNGEAEIYDEDHPETIRAEGEARARVLEARAQLHPLAQTVHALFDGLDDIIRHLGCLGLMIVVVLGMIYIIFAWLHLGPVP
jgi:hypothetical protein